MFIAALHRDWGEAYANYDELRFFTGLRPSERSHSWSPTQMRRTSALSITRARVNGIDQDVTKTGEDRRIALCPQAVAIVERHLKVREQWVRAGLIQHTGSCSLPTPAPDPARELLSLALAPHLSVRYRMVLVSRLEGVKRGLQGRARVRFGLE